MNVLSLALAAVLAVLSPAQAADTVDAGSSGPASTPPATSTPYSPVARAAPATGTAGACSRSGRLGVSTPGSLYSFTAAQMDDYMARVAATGAGWVRVPATWDHVERTRGVFDFAVADLAVDSARRHGLEPLVLLGYTPRWAATADTTWAQHPSPVPDTADWTRYLREVVTHLGGRAGAWEVWNEANLPQFWARPGVDEYTTYLRAAYPVLHGGAPGVPVLAGASVLSGTLPSATQAPAYVRSWYATGAHRAFDGIALHPYLYPDLFRGSDVPTGGFLTAQGEEVRRIMVEGGDAAKAVWVTEFGYATGGGASFSEQDQARHLGAQLRDLSGRGYTGPSFVYTLDDLPLADREASFGLTRRDGSHKPGWDAVRSFACG